VDRLARESVNPQWVQGLSPSVRWPGVPRTEPAAEKTEEDNDGPLAFTGLELRQLL